MQLGETLNSAIRQLKAANVPSPRMNGELLLMFTLGCDRAYLYGHPERELNDDERERYAQALARRSTGVPAQYITGHQEFWGMDFIVSPAVLIPRPETEHIVEAVLDRVGQAQDRVGRTFLSDQELHAPKPKIVDVGTSSDRVGRTFLSDQELHAPKPKIVDVGTSSDRVGRTFLSDKTGHEPSPAMPSGVGRASAPAMLKIIDVGTGSGCIALALARELPHSEIHTTEISPAALEIAHANAARHQLENQVHFHETDLLDGIEPDAFDFVVSNPPYVGDSEEDQVQLEVRKFEPRTAVFAGATGMEVIQRLIPQAHRVLKRGGWLIMEISGTIAEQVRNQLHDHWDEVQITNDLQGIPRVASARKRSS